MAKFIIVMVFAMLTTQSYSQKIRIVENSRLAKWVGHIKGENQKYALTIGKFIFISCKQEEFLARPWWVKHELTHVEQYKKYGVLGFFKLYLFYSLRYGYDGNPLERGAVAAETADPANEEMLTTIHHVASVQKL
jgi:hypothetical protein